MITNLLGHESRDIENRCAIRSSKTSHLNMYNKGRPHVPIMTDGLAEYIFMSEFLNRVQIVS